MKSKKHHLLALALVIPTLFSPLSVSAQNDEYTPPAEVKAESTDTTMAIDQGKLTIKHGDIKNLGMPGMTMVFRVKDPAMVKTVKAGDAVQFVVELEKGVMVITELKKKP